MSRRAIAALVLGVALAVLATTGGHFYSIDGLEYYRVADQLLTHGRLTFDPPLLWGAAITTAYTPIGYSLALLPALALGPLVHLTPIPVSPTQFDMALLYGDPAVRLLSWVNPLLVGLTAAATALLATRLGGSPRAAALGGLAAAFAGPLFFYGRADTPQALTALLLCGTLVTAIDGRRGSPRAWALLAILVTAGILVRPVDGIIAAGTAVVVLGWPGGGRSRGATIRLLGSPVLGVLAGLCGSGLVNFVRWGDPLDFGYPTGFHGSFLAGLTAELFSPGKGLLWYAPFVALSIPGFVRLFRGRRRAEAGAMGATVIVTLVIYAKWQGLGGWAWGPRYLVPLTPLLAALVAVAISRRGIWARAAFGLAAAWGVLVNTGHLAVDQLRLVWPTYGDNVYGTPGFDRQFELGAFGPIASWTRYPGGSDMALLQAAASTNGWSLALAFALLVGGLGLVAFGVWRASAARDGD